ncbi:lipocalin-like domain-containing protein [Oceanibium sediminis]|uniref:lipocalin-like domain-containing protein n=1 Tax=Oceanibium sediminis TaxID=2026339 RepID=UPI0018E59875|nr:lipocalin-like domain-containing protein [Oceanibium sediminis]
MRAKFLAMLLLILPAALAQAQGYGGLGTSAKGFDEVRPERRLSFPADHAQHPGFRIEWWYVTANLQAADGSAMGVQWTLFRQALSPEARGTGWAAGQAWMGHAAVTTVTEHRFAEAFARGGIGQAGVTEDPFEAFINDWSMRSTAPTGQDPLSDLRLVARADDFGYDLSLRAEGPLVLQGNEGYSVKSPQGQASHYYSQPFYTLTGSVTLDGAAIPVTGTAWLDREWSSQPLTGSQTGWDWFALNLPDGARLMAYNLRDADGGAYTPGTYIHPDGRPEPLADGALILTELDRETVAGREIPLRWRLALPAKGIDLTTAPLNAQSYMQVAFPYWEGPIEFTGTHEGVGYLEMTGY